MLGWLRRTVAPSALDLTRSYCTEERTREKRHTAGGDGIRDGFREAARVCDSAKQGRDAADAMDRLAAAYRQQAHPGRLNRYWTDWLDGKAHALECGAVHARRMFNAAADF